MEGAPEKLVWEKDQNNKKEVIVNDGFRNIKRGMRLIHKLNEALPNITRINITRKLRWFKKVGM